MYQQQVQYLITLLMLMDAVAVILGVYISSYVNWVVHNYDWRLDDLDAGYIALFLVFSSNYVLGRMGLYSDKRPPRFIVTVKNILVSVVIVFVLLVGLLYALKIDISRLFILLCASVMSVLFFIERALLEVHLAEQQRKGFGCHRILLAGSSERVLAVSSALNIQSSWGHKIIGYLHEPGETSTEDIEITNLGPLDSLSTALTGKSIDEVIFALSPDCNSVDLRKCIDLCEQLGTTYRIVPALYDPADRLNLRVESIQGIPTLVKRTVRINVSGMLYKRILDYAVGSLGFLVFLMLYPVIGLLIKLDSEGPVLFRQPRVGEHGRVFHIYKFRTMVTDADRMLPQLMAQNEMKGHMFKLGNDPRITKLGRFLRKSSLDEFPQFINVMRGEMSLVGTRPPTVEEVARYEARHRRRISIKPGITGLWQVSGRSKIEDFEQVLKLDLQYIDNWRFVDDVIILWKTIWVVMARKGAR